MGMSSEFESVFTSTFTKEKADKNFYTVASDKHLLASLTSARGSIASLETANKDLLDALSSRHSDLEKAKVEIVEWQNKCNYLKTEFSRLEESLEERDSLLVSRDTEIREARLKIEDLMQKLSEARSEINAANLTSSEESIKLRNLEVALDFAQK